MESYVDMLMKKQFDQASAWYRVHYNEPYFNKRFKAVVHKREKKRYYYMITFTLREDYDEKRIERIEAFIKTQAYRPALQIQSASIVRELTKAGRPHWHMAVITLKLLKKDRFTYYKKHYGNIDISKNKLNDDSEMLNYMCKSNTITKIL